MNALFEYRNSLDALRFTPEQKASLAAGAADAAKGKTHRRPLWRTVLIAACLTAALAVGAGASGVLKSAVEVFAPIFGGSAAQTEVIDKIGHPIGAGDTDNGVTITADAIIGDAYNAAIVYTIRRDDGTALLPEETDAESLLMGGFGGASLNVRDGSLKPEDGVTVCDKGRVFEEILPLEELASTGVGGIVYPISGS